MNGCDLCNAYRSVVTTFTAEEICKAIFEGLRSPSLLEGQRLSGWLNLVAADDTSQGLRDHYTVRVTQ